MFDATFGIVKRLAFLEFSASGMHGAAQLGELAFLLVSFHGFVGICETTSILASVDGGTAPPKTIFKN